MDEVLQTWIADRAKPRKAKVEAKAETKGAPAAKQAPAPKVEAKVETPDQPLKIMPDEFQAIKGTHPKHRHAGPATPQ